jgi:hypothetical protein
MRTPKLGGIKFGRHSATPTPLVMDDDGQQEGYVGTRRREGRHGISPTTQPENRPTPAGLPAGQHRKGPKPPPPAGRHRAEPDVWYPTKSDWRRLMSGETVNGHRLTSRR